VLSLFLCVNKTLPVRTMTKMTTPVPVGKTVPVKQMTRTKTCYGARRSDRIENYHRNNNHKNRNQDTDANTDTDTDNATDMDDTNEVDTLSDKIEATMYELITQRGIEKTC